MYKSLDDSILKRLIVNGKNYVLEWPPVLRSLYRSAERFFYVLFCNVMY